MLNRLQVMFMVYLNLFQLLEDLEVEEGVVIKVVVLMMVEVVEAGEAVQYLSMVQEPLQLLV
jgi:hypothetical protein